jgi:hypothetical protein
LTLWPLLAAGLETPNVISDDPASVWRVNSGPPTAELISDRRVNSDPPTAEPYVIISDLELIFCPSTYGKVFGCHIVIYLPLRYFCNCFSPSRVPESDGRGLLYLNFLPSPQNYSIYNVTFDNHFLSFARTQHSHLHIKVMTCQ